MAPATGRRFAATPDIRRGQLAKQGFVLLGDDQGQGAKRRRWMAGVANEGGILIDGDRMP
jgi:hypothetical protein